MNLSTSSFRSFRPSGFSLVEILLAIGALAVLMTAVFLFYGASATKAEVLREQQALEEVARYSLESMGSVGDFEFLSVGRLIQENALPDTWLVNPNASVTHPWGHAVAVSSFPIREAHDGFQVIYDRLPAHICVDLSAAMAAQVYDLRVGGNTVLNAQGLDVAGLAQACNRGPMVDGQQVTFIFAGGMAAAAPVVVEPPGPNPPPPPPPPPGVCTPNAPQVENIVTLCAAGFYGERGEQRQMTSTCPDPAGLPVDTWGPWTVDDRCVACPGSSVETQDQWIVVVEGCPAGWTGDKQYEARQTQQRDVTVDCPAGTLTLPPPVYGAWGPWTNTGEQRNLIDTCTPPAATGTWSSLGNAVCAGGAGGSTNTVWTSFSDPARVSACLGASSPQLSPTPGVSLFAGGSGWTAVSVPFQAPTCACTPGERVYRTTGNAGCAFGQHWQLYTCN